MIRAPKWWSVLVVICVAMAVEAQAAPLATWEDERTGLALSGYDPVAYFTEQAPRIGQAAFEVGVGEPSEDRPGPSQRYYRFANAGNRAAFLAHPDVYRPSLGGHDPVRLADGQISPGEPMLWAIHRQRLYLFRTPGARHRFLADPDGVLARITARETDAASTKQ